MDAAHNYTLEIHYVDRPAETRRIDARRIVIGRDGGDIVLNDSQASAAHAEIEFDNGQLVVRDLGSTNGTWLGERQLPQFALSPGQIFRCGNTQIRLLAILGGQQLVSGRTVMSDASSLQAQVQAHAAASTSAAAAPPGAASPYPAAPPRPEQQQGPGAVIAAALGAVAVLGGVAFGGWYVFLREQPETELAEAETPEAPEPEATEPEPAPEAKPEPQPEPDPNEVLAPEDPDLGAIYREVGAATVVIRVPGSVGSGVVIDDSGLILTNHHVIEGGTHDGLQMRAKVVFGDYSEELHTFEPRHEQVSATVMKADEDHDLALIRLDEPPADLVAVGVATDNPHPGQRVAAIGHAGVGMLWAIKGGEISATGSLAGHTDLLLDADEGDREFLEQRKQQFEKMGRVIQSTAKILPGDSGGPLVNLAGEIVGINAFGRIDYDTNQWLSFHVHLAEVREFIAKLPTRPLAMVPDAWDDAGSWSRVADVDLDAKADVLLIDGSTDALSPYSNWGALLDLDGDSFAETEHGGAPEQVNAKISELVEDRAFDAEFAVLRELSGATHYWYDRDGVGGYDLYILDEHGSGTPSGAWTLDELGGAEVIEGLELDDGMHGALFTNAALEARFAALGSVMFPSQVEAAGAEGSGAQHLPEPVHVIEDAQVSFHDGDGDGMHDLVVERSSFDSRSFYDLDQNSIGRTTSAEALKVLIDVASVDSELALVRQGANAWLWYDRDDDGRFDLVLRSRDFEGGVADEAYSLASPEAEPTPAPEHLGRRLYRPALLQPSMAARLAAHADAGWGGLGADDDGLASFPSLAVSPFASIIVDGRVAEITDEGHDLLLVDLDAEAQGSAREQADAVRRGAFEAEFALLRKGGVEWAFYDSDDDGSFDLVLVALDREAEIATQAYTVTGANTSIAQAAVGSAMINPAHFHVSSRAAQFASLAATGSFARDASP